MTCEKVQAELVECWASIEMLSAPAVEHLEECEACRHQALLLRRTNVMVQSLPTERAPDGFTSSVMARIESEESRSPGWLERLGGFLTPARQPSWARAAAVGTAIALAVAGGAVWHSQSQEPSPQPQIAAVTPGPQIAAGGAAAQQVREAELEELLSRHQAFEMTQPLADDAGVSLVVYTSN